MGVDTSNLLVANSGNDLPVRRTAHRFLYFNLLSGFLGFLYSSVNYGWEIYVFISSKVIDLTQVSQELSYLATDADLVILEGMVSSYQFIIDHTTRIKSHSHKWIYCMLNYKILLVSY